MTAAPAADPTVRRWRHQLHRICQTAFHEHATSASVAGVLAGLGFDVVDGWAAPAWSGPPAARQVPAGGLGVTVAPVS